jgi:hypothetical protein
VDIVKSAAENSRLVIAEVNPQCPELWVIALFMHMILIILFQLMSRLSSSISRTYRCYREIAQYIAGLIEDGAL